MLFDLNLESKINSLLIFKRRRIRLEIDMIFS
jgi:hypothetical protein